MRPRPGPGFARFPSLALLALLALVTAALAGCSSGSASGSASGVTVRDAWARASVGTGAPTAAYLVIANSGSLADVLTGATSPVASSVEVHETSTDSGGMTGMHPVTRLEVPAGGTVTLQPGGMHLMIMGLTKAVAAGSTLELDLAFEHAGKVVVQAQVK